ncbi:hypothetical protein DMX00_21030 [Pseudomonas fulva]|nr:hypothetical protein DMX00_21030 [Pseudomonas fulva]
MICNVRAVIYQKKELGELAMPYNMHLTNFGKLFHYAWSVRLAPYSKGNEFHVGATVLPDLFKI